jgi:hypothetical protein
MERRSVEALVRTLEAADVRYLIAGGLAVVAHGYVRFTADLDLVLDLEEGNLRRAMEGLGALSYRPRAPVPLHSFLDPETRASWIREKNLRVFSLHSPEHLATEVDLFVELPFDFAAAWREAKRLEIAPGVTAAFVGLRDLLAMKRRAGRPQDLEDAARLKQLAGPPEDSP